MPPVEMTHTRVQPQTVEQLTGVFLTLSEEHAAIATLLERLEAAPELRAELWPTIRIELLSHERGEVREVFPVIRANEETRAIADLHDFEAKEMEDLVTELEMTAMDTPEWMELFEDLANEVLTHARAEENDLFPRAQQVLGRDVADALNAGFLRAKRQLLESV
jgi:hemerythrin superfamily protein